MNCEQELLAFLSTPNADAASLRGKLFEQYAHRCLCGGGTFEIRQLPKTDDNEEEEEEGEEEAETLTLPPNQEKLLTEISTLSSEEAGYNRPVSKNFCAVDSIIRNLDGVSHLFQMTVSSSHSINKKGIENLVGFLEREIHFYFVLPPDRFGSFRRQSLTNGRRILIKLPRWASRVKQYALKIPLSPGQVPSAGER